MPIRLLLLTPEPLTAEPLRPLESEGVHLVVETGGQAARRIQEPSEYALILVDSAASEGEGAELAFRLAESGASVVLLARSPSLELAVVSAQRGLRDVLGVPVDPASVRPHLPGAERTDPSHHPLADYDPRGHLLGSNPRIRRVQEAVARLATADANVLLLGEHGTGKRTVASLLHRWGPRSASPFVEFSCAALPEPLLESELFGHEPGTFPWAISRRRGRLERAHAGTLFLDHVDKLPVRLQMRLLQSLAEGRVEHAGGGDPLPLSLRLVAASGERLQGMVDAGSFLPDLHDRLAVVVLTLPPLRERPEDLVPLAIHFARVAARQHGRPFEALSRETIRKLEMHPWPGNLRELRAAMEQAVLLSAAPTVEPEALPDSVRWPGSPVREDSRPEDALAGASLEEIEAAHIRRAVRKAGGNLSHAAEALGIHRNTLRRKLRRYGITE